MLKMIRFSFNASLCIVFFNYSHQKLSFGTSKVPFLCESQYFCLNFLMSSYSMYLAFLFMTLKIARGVIIIIIIGGGDVLDF